jgi:phospholipase C
VWLHECICRAPDGALQGHPGSGKVSLLEDFIQNIVDRTKANPKLFAETAIIVAFDESGGLYDSGFIQPLDFFGDGPRMRCLLSHRSPRADVWCIPMTIRRRF